MGVASVAVLACKLTTPVRIDHPHERQFSFGDRARQDGAHSDGEKLNVVPGVKRLALGRHFGDSDQRSFCQFARLEDRQGKRRHRSGSRIRFYFAIIRVSRRRVKKFGAIAIGVQATQSKSSLPDPLFA